MKDNKRKVWLLIGGLALALAVTYIVATVAIPRVLVTMSKAAPGTKVSLSNSYLIGAKILAKADGKDKCVVNVFAVDESGKGVSGKTIDLIGADGIVPLASVTDSTGKVGFEITSEKEGQFTLEAMIDGATLPRSTKVTFRNEL